MEDLKKPWVLQQSQPISQAEATWPIVDRELPADLRALGPGHVAVGHIVNMQDKAQRPYEPNT